MLAGWPATSTLPLNAALYVYIKDANRTLRFAPYCERPALDPVSRIIDTDCGAVLYFERQYDKAYLELSKVLEMEPGFTEALRYRGLVLLKKGKYSEAIADFESARRIDNSHRKLALLGYAYGVVGRRSQAAMVLRKLNIMSQREYVDPISFAMVTAGLGQKNKSFAFFEEAYSERSPDLRTFKVEPMWDLLRDDRRFSRLLTRIGISPSPTPSVAER